MEALKTYLRQFGELNSHQIDLITSKAKLVSVPKGTYFSEAGKVPKQVGFVLEGIFRFCYYNTRGEEITHYFVGDNQFVTDYPKFEMQAAASEYIQAVTDARILVFSNKDWAEISSTISGWERIETRIVKKCLTESIERRSPLVSEDATTRYLSFIGDFSGFVNRIPLSYVASYLGITQQSLSRIRKNIR
jgi:CRP-like cAMP-binding protein